MNINGKHWRTIWPDKSGSRFHVIDQTRLPFAFETLNIATMEAAASAIKTMIVRGAPLIGATAAYGLALAMQKDPSNAGLSSATGVLAGTRPTAVNLRWALDRMNGVLQPLSAGGRAEAAWREAGLICDEDVKISESIGEYGLELIRTAASKRDGPVHILTHCNAGWLATVDYGTALAPVYLAHDAGIDVHVWVDETRPRNQGAALTAFELGAHGVPHTLIADNAGGHLMQHGKIHMCITGTDRVAANGDTANKIGTYLKALAAHDNNVPFYVALPSTTIDWSIADGLRDIPIEERGGEEVTHMTGVSDDGVISTFRVAAPGSEAANPAFDVTPARLITGFITERGLAPASQTGLHALFGTGSAA